VARCVGWSADWKFHAGPQGRPELAGEAGGTGLRFNLSHTQGLAACVVTRGPDCGIDVEAIDRRTTAGSLAHTVLAPSELAALSKLPQRARAAGFIRYWTLKEAYAKAIGLGLWIPFDQCSFSFDSGRGVTGSGDTVGITLDGDHAGRWQFRQWQLSPAHLLALALRRGAGADLAVVDHGVDRDPPPGPAAVARHRLAFRNSDCGHILGEARLVDGEVRRTVGDDQPLVTEVLEEETHP
jgi:4'-phosphopantetheinyl transferase